MKISYSKIFENQKCKVNTIVARRTVWEKATILHHEANRPDDSPIPPRYSRHYYDLAMMAKSEVKNESLTDIKLLQNVVDLKKDFIQEDGLNMKMQKLVH